MRLSCTDELGATGPDVHFLVAMRGEDMAVLDGRYHVEIRRGLALGARPPQWSSRLVCSRAV